MLTWDHACLLLALTCKGLAGEKRDDAARRYVEKTGGFSLVVPDSWKTREIPGWKYKAVFGPVRDGFASNINIVDEASKLSLNEYVKGNIATLMRLLKHVEVVKNEEFKTAAGLQGARLIIENEQNGKRLRQALYFFGTAEKKYVVTCTTVAEGGEKLDPIFERAMKTFRFEKP